MARFHNSATASQLTLWNETNLDKVVNVASVAQLSPFRYPGGKTWLIPRLMRWLGGFPVPPRELIEPFAGGAIVSLTTANLKLADHVTMVELDASIAAVWQSILGGHAEWLANEIMNFELTIENVAMRLKKDAITLPEYGFQTLLKNRIYHGGIIAPGAGTIKNGENGKGISSRWYPETLRKRILKIASLREHITFVNGDGIQVMRDNANHKDTVFFIDPPYTAGGKKAGKRLYTHHELDHEELFRVASTFAGEFLMTYDNAEDVKRLAHKYGFETKAIAMKNTHHAEMNELLIGKSLSWLE